MSPTLDLYLAPTGGLAASSLSALADLLDTEERARAARLPQGPARRDFLAAHALARHVLSRHRPALPPRAWRFTTGPHGKPAPLGAEGLAFSLSHGAGLVAVAVSEGTEVGVDVEPLAAEAHMERIAPVFCAPDEQVALSVMAPEARRAALLALWTLKESLVKAVGRGFSLSPRDICCAFAPFELLRWPLDGKPPLAFLARLEVARLEAEGAHGGAADGVQVAVAMLGSAPPMLRVHRVHALEAGLASTSDASLAAAFRPVGIDRVDV